MKRKNSDRRFFDFLRSSNRNAEARKSPRSRSLRLESLEERQLLSAVGNEPEVLASSAITVVQGNPTESGQTIELTGLTAADSQSVFDSLENDSVNYHRRVWMKGNYPETPIYGDIFSIDGANFTIRTSDGSLQTYARADFCNADRAYLDVLESDPAKLESELERAAFRQDVWDPAGAAETSQGAPDLDVLFISRTPGSPALHGRVDYPDGVPQISPAGISAFNGEYYLAEGAPTEFTATVANYGDAACGSFEAQWKIDGVNYGARVVCPALAVGERIEISVDWTWTNGAHTITLELDPDNEITETCEWNNQRTDSVQGAGFVVAVSEGVWERFRQSANLIGSKSPEDFLQWHMDIMNQKFSEAFYEASPDGCDFRVRIDRILISTSREDGNAKVAEYSLISQGNWSIESDYSLPTTSPDWGLIHEWGHQLGLIDYYRLDIPAESVRVTDDYSRPLNIGRLSFPDVMMHSHGANPFCELTAAALNRQITVDGQQTPRGFYGDYLFEMCDSYSIRVLDRDGRPLANSQVDFYQRNVQNELITDSDLAFTVVTDANGIAALPNRTSPVATTTGGFTSKDNPFGQINVVGINGLFLVRARQANGESSWSWLEIQDFCVPAYRGETSHVFEIQTTLSSLPCLDAPTVLSATPSGNAVVLTVNSSPDATGYAIQYKTASDADFATYRYVYPDEYLSSDQTTTSFRLAHLDFGTEYQIRLKALGDDVANINSTWSEIVSATTGTSGTTETPSIVVTARDDAIDPYDGLTSLREAIACAGTGNFGTTITFDPSLKGGTIRLNGGELLIDRPMTVDASALWDAENDAPGLTIDGQGFSRVFHTLNGTQSDPIQLLGLTIANGKGLGYGGGVFNGDGVVAELVVRDCVIRNCVSSENGGGLFHGSDNTADLYNVTFENNYSGDRGGGVFSNGQFYAENCRFVNNHSKYDGGGLYLIYNSTVVNCLVVNNSTGASANGGGIGVIGGSQIIGSTIVDNEASRGSDIYATEGSSIALKNSIVALDGDGDVAVESDSSVSAYNTLSSFVGWTGGANNYIYDPNSPLFADAAIGDYQLVEDSQAIDRGNNEYAATAADLAGKQRVRNQIVDLGAYEFQPNSEVELNPDDVAKVEALGLLPTDAGIVWNEFGRLKELTLRDPSVVEIRINDCLALEKLDVSGCENLKFLYCERNNLSQIDAYGCSKLLRLYAQDNNFTELDLAKFPTVEGLWCYNNKLTQLDFTACPNIVEVWCYNNNISSLNFSGNSKLGLLQCVNNRLTLLDLSDCANMKDLNFADNDLSEIDLSACSGLLHLRCGNNNLSALDLPNRANLTTLACERNALTSLDLSSCASLSDLNIEVNALSEIDLSDCRNLKYLRCADNNLAELDVSNSPILEEIYCANNPLTSIDLSDRRSLRRLDCYNNDLTQIDASGCVNLQDVRLDPDLESISISVVGQTDLRVYRDGSWDALTVVDLDGNAQQTRNDGAFVVVPLSSDSPEQLEIRRSKSGTQVGTTLVNIVPISTDVLSTVVTTLDDVVDFYDGVVSLREGINYAGTNGLGTTITFDPSLKGGTITLGGSGLSLGKSITIDAIALWDAENDAPGIAIDANRASGFFNTGDALTLKGLAFQNGKTTGHGPIEVYGGFEASYCVFSNNEGGLGGVLKSDDCDVSVDHCSFVGNRATSQGGALRLANSIGVSISNSTFVDNSSGNDGGAVFIGYNRQTSVLDNCYFSSNSAALGGAIRFDDASVSIANSNFEGNVASNEGGAIKSDAGSIAIENCDFSDNVSTNNGGAAQIWDPTQVSVVDSSFARNASLNHDGGAIFLRGGTFSFEGVDFTDNGSDTVYVGGAIYVEFATGSIQNGTFVGNAAKWYGGGIAVREGTTLVVGDSRFEQNVSLDCGGAVQTRSGGTMTVSNTELVGNYAGNFGGAFDCDGAIDAYDCVFTQNSSGGLSGAYHIGYSGTGSATNCSFIGNTATGDGGAIRINGRGTFENVLFAGNSASGNGGGVYAGPNSTFTGATIVGNSASGTGGGVYGNGGTFRNSIIALNEGSDVVNSAVALNTLSLFTAWSNASSEGVVNYLYDPTLPLFADAANGDYRLAFGSQGVDKGNGDCVSIQTDLDGGLRVVGGSVDLGAYELQMVSLQAPTVSFSTTKNSVVLGINAVEGATDYVVEYGTDPTFETCSSRSFPSAGVKTISGLTYATIYYFRVKATGDGYADSAWTVFEATTLAPPAETKSTVVTTLADSVDPYDGAISLREAIDYAGTDGLGTTITFDASLKGGTITLGGSELAVGKELTIDASALWDAENDAPGIAVSGNNASRVLNVTASFAMTGVTITGGNSEHNSGGGVYVTGTAIFTNCDISGNSAQYGGGIAVIEGSATFDNVSVCDNTASMNAGGVWIYNSTVIFDKCSLRRNSARSYSAVLGERRANVSIMNSVISDNNGNGSALYIYADALYGGNCIVMNTVVSGNEYWGVLGNATVINSTVVNNWVGVGNGVTLYDSIVALNLYYDSNGNVSAHNTLSSYTEWTNASDEGVVNYVYDETLPLFVDAENGDYRLALGSQAIDKGDNAFVQSDLDLAGNARIQNGVVDLGAYESLAPLDVPTITLSGTKNAVVVKIDPVDGAEKYVVEYSTDSKFSTYSTKTYSSAGVKTLSGLSTGTWYYVRVKATATGRPQSAYTPVAKAYTGGKLAMPAFSASAVKTSITLNIKAVEGGEKYVVEYSENEDFSNAKTKTFNSGVRTIAGLTFGTKYYIRVKATSSTANDSAWNVLTFAAGQLATPSRSATSIGVDFVKIKCWNSPNNSGFEIRYSTSSDFSDAQYARTEPGKTVCEVTGLASDTKYYFSARALGDNVSRVDSNWSPSFSATTKPGAVSSAVLDAAFEEYFEDELDDFWGVLNETL